MVNMFDKENMQPKHPITERNTSHMTNLYIAETNTDASPYSSNIEHIEDWIEEHKLYLYENDQLKIGLEITIYQINMDDINSVHDIYDDYKGIKKPIKTYVYDYDNVYEFADFKKTALTPNPLYHKALGSHFDDE